MSVITKDVTISCGKIWKVKAARINFDSKTVQMGLESYKTQTDLAKGISCGGDSITVSADGFDGTEEWCLNALKSDTDSKLNGGKIS